MKKTYVYKAVSRLDLLNPKFKLLHRLNVIAFICILISCTVGLFVNYFIRMHGVPGGMYFIYTICGFIACILYPYIHEFAHAVAVIAIKRQVPSVKFGKFAASCGSSDIYFNKIQYFIVASFPFVIYCLIFIPLCIFIPPVYFPIPFMPLAYNVFGSLADLFMIKLALSAPKKSIIVDCGTDTTVYSPVYGDVK